MTKSGQKSDNIDNIIREYVFDNLGKPKNLDYIIIKNVFDCFYRVNIYCEKKSDLSVKCSEITDSFFIKALDGEVKSCDPEIIEKKYFFARNKKDERL